MVLGERYQLTDVLGHGGAGTVYQAIDRRTGGLVAVKVLHPALAGDNDYTARLRREATIAASLISPRIVRITDFDEHAGTPFLVMEYVAGQTLREYLDERGRLPVHEALTIALEVARALAAAHEHGIVHRDLKPNNIKLVEGQVKVLDFGVARAEGLPALTVAGTYLGTPDYSAPEQADGRDDSRSDLYALGVILYELVAGRRPFQGRTALEVLAQHAHVPPPSLGSDVPHDVQDLIMRCLGKAPSSRYQTAAELSRALEASRARLPQVSDGCAEPAGTPSPETLELPHPVTPMPVPESDRPSASRSPLPTGTLTFLFTDVEGSTRLWDQHSSQMRAALVRHDQVIEALVEREGGTLVRPRGEGDSRFAVFKAAVAAAVAAIDIQRALVREPWPPEAQLRVRIALHTGEADLRDGDYYGSVVNRCARLRGIAHGGQILVSDTSADLIRDRLPASAVLRDAGTHRLMDLSSPEHVFELTHPDLAREFPPLRSARVRPARRADQWQPGEPPRAWNMPLHRNPNFTGRDRLLTQLRSTLVSGQPAALTQALTGLGGVGKTQLAVEYVYRHAEEYEVIWWIRADEPTMLAADYAALARGLGLQEANERDQARVVARVHGWLRQHEDWLLVFDNANAPGVVGPYLPTGAQGHVLITSRHRAWRALAQPLAVHVLPREDAVRFLLERTGQADARVAHEVAEAVGDLPLALEQAGAYMDVKHRSFDDYLALFHAHQQDLLGREPPPADYPATVVTTWEMALQQVAQISPVAADLLHLCAFLAPDQIDRSLLSGGAEYLPRPLADAVRTPLAFDDAIEPILRYSLMDATDGRLSMHRLVQTVTRDRLGRLGPAQRRAGWSWLKRKGSANAQRTWAEAAVRLVDAAFPRAEADTWATCAALLPHALAACGHAERLDVAVTDTSRLLNRVGFYLGERAQFAQARDVLERALAACETSFGAAHANTIASLNSLGALVRAQGDLRGARPFVERAVAGCEQAFGTQHPETATSLTNLGSLLRAQGNLASAEPPLARALAIREAALGPHHPLTGVSLGSLGSLLFARGDYAEARPYLERSLVIARASPTPGDVPAAMTNLAVLLHASGDLHSARPLLEEALDIRERALGAEHRDTITSRGNLGSLLLDEGNTRAARPLLEHALASGERELGPTHPHLATCLVNMGGLLAAEGDLLGARECLERALVIREHALGADHPHTVAVVKKLQALPLTNGSGSAKSPRQ